MGEIVKKRKRKITKDKIEEQLTAYLFIIPLIVLWIIWFAVPFVQAFNMSFYEFSFANSESAVFVGLQNYITILRDPYFWIAFRHTILFVAVTVPLTVIISVPIAAVLNSKIRCRGLFRTIMYMPNVVSSVAVTTVFMYLFVQNGFITKILTVLGFPNVTWYTNVKLALAFVMIIYLWQVSGFYIIIYLSGMQGISNEIYDASKVDGANAFQTLLRITVPLLRPTLFFGITYSIINAFQVFDQIAALCNNSVLGSPAGATSTLVTYFYSYSFHYYEMGYGCAAAIILFAFIMFFTVIQQFFTNKKAY